MKNLKTISFAIHIDAVRNKVWNTLWNPKTYEKWTKVFSEGSHYQRELKQGHSIQFLGNEGGMIALVEKMIENEQMVFIHQKEVKNGVESESSWQGAKEIYYLKKDSDNGIELQVILDVTPEMEDYFRDRFPKALEKVKQISEQESVTNK